MRLAVLVFVQYRSLTVSLSTTLVQCLVFKECFVYEPCYLLATLKLITIAEKY